MLRIQRWRKASNNSRSGQVKNIQNIWEDKKVRATGIVRRIDEIGRIVLPAEIRNQLGITERDAMEIMYDEDGICLKRYDTERCALCTKREALIRHAPTGKYICRACLVQVNEETSENTEMA